MSYFKGFGTGSNSYGQFWFGGSDFPGFLYKKNVGVAGRKNPKYGLLINKQTDIWNKYTPGAGVGVTNPATRRAKMRLATYCNNNQVCGKFYRELGQNQIRPTQYTTYNANFTS
jgi:hypothetical protein